MNLLQLERAAPVNLQALVRELPDRRAVYRAEWQGQAVFVKVFHGPQAARYASRDAQGARWMQSAGLTTPALLWQGQTANQQSCVLIYAAVPQAVNADQAYIDAVSDRLALLQSLVVALAAQHAAGLCQTDLHLKNFLLAEGRVWAIDGDGIRRQSLSVRQAHRQLAELISKLYVLDQHAMVDSLLTTYLQARQWPVSISARQVLQWAKCMKRQEVERYVCDKIFRNCSDVRWQANADAVQAVSVAGGLPPVDVHDLEALVQTGQALKLGNTCTVVSAQWQQQAVVIKRYNIKHLWHALSRAWRPSRAAASWSSAHRLRYYGFLTPAPLLMLETRYLGLRGKAFFVAAWSPWPDALTFFAREQAPALRAQAMQQLVMLCYQWYLLQLSHGDLKATNLQVTDQGQIVVMDLDSMQQHRCPRRALRAHARDLRRLLQNWKQDTSLYNALLENFKRVYPDHAPLKLAGISL